MKGLRLFILIVTTSILKIMLLPLGMLCLIQHSFWCTEFYKIIMYERHGIRFLPIIPMTPWHQAFVDLYCRVSIVLPYLQGYLCIVILQGFHCLAIPARIPVYCYTAGFPLSCHTCKDTCVLLYCRVSIVLPYLQGYLCIVILQGFHCLAIPVRIPVYCYTAGFPLSCHTCKDTCVFLYCRVSIVLPYL